MRRPAIGRGAVAILVLLASASGYAAITGAASAADASTEQLHYQVHHSVFGDIGTYTNIVQHSGDSTIVQTTAHFLVKMLGVALRRENDQRTEHWQNGRLISFSGITKKNGEAVALKGEASGDTFVIQSPLGTFTAPANVQPANPWSTRCLKSTTLMRVDNGEIEKVRVGGGLPADIQVGGATIPARQYEIDGTTRYKIWFDQRGIPVMFVVDDNTGKITFTLEH